MSTPCVAYIRGMPETPSVTKINIRSGPNRDYERVLEAPVGLSSLPVLEVRADEKGAGFQGKTYQWFKLQFPDGQTGWARDDLIEIVGDATPFGYSLINVQTFAFVLKRDPNAAPFVQPSSPAINVTVTTPPPAVAAPPTPPPAVATPATPTVNVTVSTPATPGAVNVTVSVPSPAVPAPTAAPAGPATVIPIMKTSARTRVGPAITAAESGIYLDRHGRYPLLGVQREFGGQNYRWFKVSAQGREVWVREDLVTYEGDTAALGLPGDLYPSPMKENYWWVRGFNMPPNKDNGLVDHDGWDLGANTGEPIYCGPNGGLVVKSFECVKCTPDRPSTLSQGYSLGDPSIFMDQGWGNGYGHHIIVRYTNEQLPQSTRDLLAARGFPGGAIFVMYAHLAARLAGEGQTLAGGQQIGVCGNTGNSEAAHLHLEIRAGKQSTFTGWYNFRSGVMDAVALFKR